MGHRGTAQKCTLVGLSRQYMVRRFEYAIILVKACFVFASRADTDRQIRFLSTRVPSMSLCDLSESARAPPAPHAPQPHPHAQSNPVIHLLVLPHPQTTMFKRTRLARPRRYPPSLKSLPEGSRERPHSIGALTGVSPLSALPTHHSVRGPDEQLPLLSDLRVEAALLAKMGPDLPVRRILRRPLFKPLSRTLTPTQSMISGKLFMSDERNELCRPVC